MNEDIIDKLNNRINDRDERIAELEAENRHLKQLAEASERWRLAYQKGKLKLYEMGGDIADAAMKHLPCNEGGLDRLSKEVFLYPHFEAWKQKQSELEQQLREAQETIDNLRDRCFHDFVLMLKRNSRIPSNIHAQEAICILAEAIEEQGPKGLGDPPCECGQQQCPYTEKKESNK